jgi:hypothetical protein
VSDRNMFSIHRLAIGGFLFEDLRTYSGGWIFLYLKFPCLPTVVAVMAAPIYGSFQED